MTEKRPTSFWAWLLFVAGLYLAIAHFAPFVSAFAQSGTGTVTVSTSVTAVAQQSATDANAITCTATPSASQVAVSCKVGAVTGFTGTYTLVPGSTSATNAASMQYNFGGNAITLMLYQPLSTGPITWQVSANGTSKNGQF